MFHGKQRRPDTRSDAARAWRGWYSTARWHAIRERRRAEEPLCRYCMQAGHVEPMHAVDHVKPHRGDLALFFDFDNTQSLCKPCHDSAAQRKDKRGYLHGVDVNGRPLDPDHPWNRRAAGPVH